MKFLEIKTHQQTFIWSGFSIDGLKKSGEINALTKNIAIFYLKQNGIRTLTIKKKRNNYLTSFKKISNKTITVFFRQLATLINAGISLVQAFNILYEGQTHKDFKLIILQIKHHLESGKSLAHSIMQSTHNFKPIIFHLIHLGEQSGQLSLILNSLADDLEKKYQFKKKLQQALIYPGFILMIAMTVCLLMLMVVVPRFAAVFAEMKIALPPLTNAVIQISHRISQTCFILFPVLIIFFYFLKNSSVLQKSIPCIVQTIPILGPLFNKALLRQFAQNLKITFEAGLSITESLRLMGKGPDESPRMSNILLNLHHEITKGKQLHHALSQNSFFPTLFVQMIKVGEETGMLDKMLEKIATLYEFELDQAIKTTSQLIEPLLMILLGILIGGLVLAMYLPIFKLGSAI